MTLAHLFNYLRTETCYFDRRATRESSFAIILENPIIQIKSKTDIEDLISCMFIHPAMLEDATHNWAYELGCAFNMTATDSGCVAFFYWIAGRLREGYIRSMSRDEIRSAMQEMLRDFTPYRRLSLNEALAFAHERRAEIEQNRHRRAEADNETIISLRAQLAKLRAQPADALARIERLRIMVRVSDEALIDARKKLAIHNPSDDIEHARANDRIAVRVYLPDSEKPVSMFLRPEKLGELNELFTKPIEEGEGEKACCQMCLTNGCDLSCGNDGCAGSMCERCFHEWHASSSRCPYCNRNYVPIGSRSATGTTGSEAEVMNV